MTGEMKISLVGDIITNIVCSDTWGQEQLDNPVIAEKTARLESMLRTIGNYVPETLMCELESTIYEYTGAYESAAILFGIHVADALREIAAKPSAYLRT